MKIASADGGSWIRIERTGDPRGYSGFEMDVHVDIGHGVFDAKNSDVQFLHLGAFVSALDRFITDRSRTPRLEGTYDTYLVFSGAGTVVFLEYCLGDAHCGKKTVSFRQTGAFEVAQEELLPILRGFGELCEAL